METCLTQADSFFLSLWAATGSRTHSAAKMPWVGSAALRELHACAGTSLIDPRPAQVKLTMKIGVGVSDKALSDRGIEERAVGKILESLGLAQDPSFFFRSCRFLRQRDAAL